MCQCPYPVSSAVRKTPSEAARSALESPQDLSDQIWDTEKGAIRYRIGAIALQVPNTLIRARITRIFELQTQLLNRGGAVMVDGSSFTSRRTILGLAVIGVIVVAVAGFFAFPTH